MTIFTDVQTLLAFWLFSFVFCILPLCVFLYYATDWFTDDDD